MDTTTSLPPATEATPTPRPALPADLTPTAVPWRAVAVYAVLACALAWLVQLPIWLSGEGLSSPLFLPLTAIMMLTPAIAALIVTFTMIRPANKARYLGLTPFPKLRSILLMVGWPLIWLGIGFAAFGLAVALGWATPDWTLSEVTPILPEMTAEQAVLATFVALPVNVVLSSVPAFGEELGWRGFLTTALAPLGFWRSALVSGLIWGIWHAPIVLLGYNFARPGLDGLLLMCGFTFAVGVLLQWSRYWTRNVWVAAVGHGALNASAPLTLTWLSSSSDSAIATILGMPGWIAMGVLVAAMAAVGLFGRRLPRPLVPAPQPRPELAPQPVAAP